MKREILRGTPTPPGANWDGHGVNFALFSANAERVELCLFDPAGHTESERIALERSGDWWHAYLPGCGPGTIYGYRVHGPYAPDEGHRFNADNPNRIIRSQRIEETSPKPNADERPNLMPKEDNAIQRRKVAGSENVGDGTARQRNGCRDPVQHAECRLLGDFVDLAESRPGDFVDSA